MPRLPALLCLALLTGCAGTPKTPDGTWINQAAVDAASQGGSLREALLAYGPNLEWRIDSQHGEAAYSNGAQTAQGRLLADGEQRWTVRFTEDVQENLQLADGNLQQQASPQAPEQRFVRSEPGARLGSRFEQALYQAYLSGQWKIEEGLGQGGLVLFHPDGRIEGLPGAERYALCLAGDCAAMSGEHDSLWLQQGQQGAPWLFQRDGDQLHIFQAHNRASADQFPDFTPGAQAWLLRRD